MYYIFDWQEDGQGDSAPPRAAVHASPRSWSTSMQDAMFELTNKMAEEAEEQREITRKMIDDGFAAMRQEMEERFRATRKELQAQFGEKLQSQRWASKEELRRAAGPVIERDAFLDARCKGLQDRLDEVVNQVEVQRRVLKEQLTALTQNAECQAESEDRAEAFRLLLQRVDSELKKEKADLRKATSTVARALQQDRDRREATEKRLEQMLGSCKAESAATRAQMDALRRDVAGWAVAGQAAPLDSARRGSSPALDMVTV